MSNLNTQYTDYSIYKLAVDSLESDGALCNYYNKEYDEQGTLEGGIGDRLAFKKINDKIKIYHKLLKLLDGEQRANISETIPVIDFVHPENTSFLYTYTLQQGDNTKIDPSSIIALDPQESNESALDLIVNEDDSIINRALSGSDLAEHFYNNINNSSGDYNIQVDTYRGDYSLIYKGIISGNIYNPYTKEILQSTRVTTILVRQVPSVINSNTSSTEWIEFDPLDDYEEAGTDDRGNVIPTPNTTIGNEGINFIYNSNESNSYSLELSSNDILIILPSASGSSDNTKFLLFKYNPDYDANIGTDEENNKNAYYFFVIPVSSYNITLSMDEVALNGELPSYINNDFILNYLNDYIRLDKEYYSIASGLLNGYYSEPVERDSNGKVNKWKFVDDIDVAAEKGAVIDVGSKYYPGHILGRGFPIDQPFKLTSHDSNPDGKYKGKATLFYDSMMAAANRLLSMVQVPWAEWNSVPLRSLDYVVTKADYSEELLSSSQYLDLLGQSNQSTSNLSSRVAHPEKFKDSSGKVIDYIGIKDYIDNCCDFIIDNGDTLVLDPVSKSDFVCYTRQEYEDNDKNKNMINQMGPGDVRWTKPKMCYYIQWGAIINGKDHKYKTNVKNPELRIASPINAFAPSGASEKKTILLYPEYNKIFPGEIYLISSYDLKLELYQNDPDGSPTKGMCTFYNNKDKKLICFKVSNIVEFLPSKLNHIKLYDPARSTQFTIDNWTNKGNTSDDCYIYTLRPMEISLSGINLYDWNDNIMELEEGVADLQIVPMSYPSDYFPVRGLETPNGIEYQVETSHRSTDINYLKNSYILAGLPQYTNPDFFRTHKKSSTLPLNLFAEMLDSNSEEGIGSILKKSLQKGLSYAINQFPLSDGETNPITFKDFPDILDSFIELKPYLNQLIESGFEIPFYHRDSSGNLYLDEDNPTSPLSEEDINGINRRVDYDDNNGEYTFNITYTNSTFEGDSYSDNLKKRLDSIKMEDITPENKSARPSLKKLKGYIDAIFKSDGNLTRKDCEKIDEFLGNGSLAFIRYSSSRDIESTPTSVLNASTTIQNLIVDIMVTADSEFKAQELDSFKKEAFYNFYTSESVDSSIINGNINKSGLQIDWDKPLINSYLALLKNDYKSLASSSGNILQAMSWGNKWKRLSVSNFKYYLGFIGNSKRATNAESNAVRKAVENYAYTQSNLIYQNDNRKDNIKPISKNDVIQYLYEDPSRYSSTEEVVYEENSSGEQIEKYRMHAIVKIPDQDEDYNLIESSLTFEFYSPSYSKLSADVCQDVLYGIAEFVRTSLEGTGESNYYVKYVEGDKGLEGRENSLYYKRYQMLNNRMNRAQGNLAKAANYLNSVKTTHDVLNFGSTIEESYKKFLRVIPIKKMTELAYFPEQTASASTIAMEGKFYIEKELEELRKLINDKCVLTCNYCEVKDSCVFYNEEEVLKLYCTEAENLDIFLKDNELDLIYYDNNEEDPSPYLVYNDPDGDESEILDSAELQKIHLPYSDILKKIGSNEKEEETYEANDLESLREKLNKYIPNFDEEARAGIGFLLKGRYGTVEVNDLSKINTSESSLTNDEIDSSQLPKYKLLYNALYISDEETEFIYRPSNFNYPVELIRGPYEDKKVYKGTTKIKIPVTLKAFVEANPNDDVYLVSDDLKDSNGNSITPVIYLNTVGNLVYAFDLQDTGLDNNSTTSDKASTITNVSTNTELLSEDDSNLYASDVAQWCVNYAKGPCYEDPIGSHSDKNLDKDQYWMNEIRKKVVNKDGDATYITTKGRPRVDTGYQEQVINESDYDSALAVSGRPIVARYSDFIRRISFRMYYTNSNGEKVDLIKWVKSNSSLDRETQRSILPIMKTNLRLVIVNNDSVQ